MVESNIFVIHLFSLFFIVEIEFIQFYLLSTEVVWIWSSEIGWFWLRPRAGGSAVLSSVRKSWVRKQQLVTDHIPCEGRNSSTDDEWSHPCETEATQRTGTVPSGPFRALNFTLCTICKGPCLDLCSTVGHCELQSHCRSPGISSMLGHCAADTANLLPVAQADVCCLCRVQVWPLTLAKVVKKQLGKQGKWEPIKGASPPWAPTGDLES